MKSLFFFFDGETLNGLQLILRVYGDKVSLKILNKCKEAIPDDGGKVIIIDVVINKNKVEHQVTETKLLIDMLMMAEANGRE